MEAPTGVTATAVSTGEIDLSWTDSNVKLVQQTETGFSIERSLSGTSGFAQIATTSKNTLTYRNIGLASSTTYYYRVRILGRNGVVSPYSIVVSANTLANGAIADVSPPVVSISSPTSGAVYLVSQTVILTATASDDVGVTSVEFYDGTTLMSTATTVPYTHTWSVTSANNGMHSWTAKAYDGSGKNKTSTVVSLTVSISDTVAPSIPTGLTAATASCSQVNLSWATSSDTGGSGLAGYRVYRNGVQIATTSVTSYSNTSLAASTGYSFTVAAYDNAGNVSAESAAASATTPSCPDTAAPSIPTGLTAAAAGCNQVNLSWAGSSDTGGSGLAGYRVYRNGVQIATTNLTSYRSTSLAASTSYSFTVAAYDNTGNVSAESAAASATTPSCPDTVAPSLPTGLTAVAASCNQVNLSWSASSDTGGSGL
ncbi:MAG TPA: Ig-like domain-containing protein, partial [Gemmatimonadales bacterium]|nr:Ig-like domain-containing protein [Gemmatimonadales bacterium]